jgi:very-short-patch-repair endonuclease
MRDQTIASIARARDLRRDMTDAERKLWLALRDRRLAGLKFVRQMPVGCFIADFCCREARLIVEVDGSQHAGSARDMARDARLKRLGFRVVRFWNHEVLCDMPMVLDTIYARATETRDDD